MDTDAFDSVEVGRQLGHDLHGCSRLPLQPDWPAPVREGFLAAAAGRSPRQAGDRFQRKWLQLRLGAFNRQRVVAPDVTPDLLRELDLDHCPVTRQPLTHGLRADTDASVDRLNNDAAYAASNLAVMSVRANRAKGCLSFEAVWAAARGQAPAGELTREEWLRLAVLMQGPAFATRQHLAPLLPLVAPLPCRSVRLAMQQIQRLFTLEARRPSGRNLLVRAFAQAAPAERAQMRLRRFGDVIHEALRAQHPGDHCWDVWLQPQVMAALQQWRESLDELSWARVARLSGQLAGGQRVSAASLAPWHLASRGYQPRPASA